MRLSPGPDFDALPRVLREGRQLRDDVEDAWLKVQETVLSVGLADADVCARNGRAHRGDGDPWQYSALGVADHTPHRAFAGNLRVHRSCRQEQQQGNQIQPLSHRCNPRVEEVEFRDLKLFAVRSIADAPRMRSVGGAFGVQPRALRK